MTTYIQAQFNKVRDLASAKSETIQFTLQIVCPVGKTNHLTITIGQLNAIQKIGGIMFAKLNQIDDHIIAFLCGAFLGVLCALFI